MSPVSFDSYIAKHDEGVSANRNKGYYFHESSAYTAEFAEAFPEVVSAALDMQIGEYEKVELSIGVCYIYKYEPTAADYLVFEDGTFSDFYLNGAAYMYSRILEELSSNVNIKESYSAIDPVTLPYNSDLIAKFS
jgi:hypothetical protein